MSSEWQANFERARAALPLRRVIEQAGLAPANQNWKSFPKCPFCGHDGAGTFTSKSDGAELFKCHHVPCPSANKALDEIGFIAAQRGLSRDEAWKVYFKEAGVWREERLAPSVMPGTSRRKSAQAGQKEDGEDSALVAECMAAIRAEGRASVSFLQRKLGLGYTRAARMIDLLEERGVIGPARGTEPREVLNLAGDGTDETEGIGLRCAAARPAEGATAPEIHDDHATENVLDAVADLAAAELDAVRETTSKLEAAAEESAAVASAGAVPDAHASTETPASSSSPSGVPSISKPTPPGEGNNKLLSHIFGEGKDNPPPPPPAFPAGSPPEGEPPSPAVAALRWFYERLTLLENDRQLLWRKRGLTAETAAALGYRSNSKTNKAILLEMANHFPPMVLLDSGLWKYPSDKAGGEDSGKSPQPNPQYYGMALVQKRDPQTGRKIRDEDDQPIVEPVWGDPDCLFCRQEWGCAQHAGPILIPYFDALGELIHLRPHKGMMRDRTPRFYIARPGKAFLEKLEEASVRRRYVERAVGVGAVPGITMAKLLLPDVEEWLETLTANEAVIAEGEFKAGALWQELDELATGTIVRRVAVVYDNEDKKNPALPGYQEEDWKQLEVEVWSRFLAGLLLKQGYDAAVGHLPDEWRNAKGKADWDGRLADRLRELGVSVDPGAYPEAHPQIRAEFQQVLKLANPIRTLWQSGLFDSKENRLINNRLDRLNYERQLPVGGEDEETIVRRLRRLIPRLRRSQSIPLKSINFLSLVAAKYEATKGGYYIYKALPDKERDRWEAHNAAASENGDADLKRACELVLHAGPEKTGGLPQRISDFHMRAHFCLVKTSGERERLVSLHNIHGVRTKMVRLPAEDFAQPAKFREWLLNNISGGTWRAGERELQAMQEDIGRDLARKEISEVSVRGYHADSRCWFFGDVVYLPDGTSVRKDKDGVIWVKSQGELTQGYVLSEKAQENQKFCQGMPLMHPDAKISEVELRAFFQAVSEAFMDTQGSQAGLLAMGSVLAMFAGPEIFAKWNAVSSLWVHGQSREGKSCFVRWLLRMLGFNTEKGMPLLDSTKVGISIALQQYGESMIWFEEFQPRPPGWLIEKLKNVYDRGSGIKKTFEDDPREIRSGAIVTGISTSTDVQLRSRCVHVQVAKKNRRRQLFDWFQAESPRFFHFGRFAMEHRKQFAARTVELMQLFLSDPRITGMDERSRMVHGAAYAAYTAYLELLGLPLGTMLEEFRTFTIGYARENEVTVNARMNIVEFWQDMLNANRQGAFGETPAERNRVFKVVEDKQAKCPVSPYQLKVGADYPKYAWKPVKFYFKASVLLDMMRKHKRQRGDDPPLSIDDLLNHMKVQPYWLPPTSYRGHSQRFGDGSKVKETCWCILADLHDMGYVPVTDAEFEASLHPEENPDIWLSEDKWIDPRKGDLWALIDSLKSQKSGEAPPDDAV